MSIQFYPALKKTSSVPKKEEFNVLFFYSAGININKVKTETKHVYT